MKYKLDNVSAPWLESYGEVAPNLNYSEKTISAAVLDVAAVEKDFPALTFMGKATSYTRLAKEIDRVARSFHALGVRPGQRVLVCLPNVPQAVFCLYGLNRIGAIPTMVHPLSAVAELAFYMKEANCSVAVTLDQFYGKFLRVKEQRPISKLIVCRVSEELPFPLSVAQKLFTESKFPKVKGANDILWSDFMKMGDAVTEGYVAKKATLPRRTTAPKRWCSSPAALPAPPRA